MKIGNGTVRCLRPEMILGLYICELAARDVAEDLGRSDAESRVVLAHGIDGVHSRASRHYLAAAEDFVLRDQGDVELRSDFYRVAADRLGPEYDLVDEKDHFHLEFDPKQAVEQV